MEWRGAQSGPSFGISFFPLNLPSHFGVGTSTFFPVRQVRELRFLSSLDNLLGKVTGLSQVIASSIWILADNKGSNRVLKVFIGYIRYP